MSEHEDKAKMLLKEINSSFENEYKGKLEALEKAVASNKGTAEVEATLAKMDVRLNEVQRDLDEANAVIKSGSFTSGSDKGDRLEKDYSVVANKLLKSETLTAGERDLVDTYNKSFNVGTGNQGGVLVPRDLADSIMRQIEVKVPFLSLADVRQTSFAESSFLVQTASGGVSVGDETTPVTDSSTPTIEEVLIRAFHIEAEPWATRQMLEDGAFDMLGFIRDEVAETIADKLGALIVSGAGTTEPKGILTSGGASSTYAIVKEISAATPGAGVPAGTFALDDLYTVKYDVNRRYKMPGATAWVMGDQAMAAMRKLKDTTGQYLWQPTQQVGEPNNFDGEAVYFSPNMPALTATVNLDAIMYGNFAKGLGIVQHSGGTVVIVDELTNKKYVKYYTKQRWGAGVVDARALRILRTAAIGA